MSHQTVEVDENGDPVLKMEGNKIIDPKYVYVDEQSCIGCTMCAIQVPGTFMMERDFGKARVMR